MRSVVVWAALGLVGCKTDIGLTESAYCDGKKQVEEDTVDAPFDRDGDGFFDGSNPGCQESYAAEDLDCSDADPDVHPGAAEAACNGVDDDCDAATLDAVDQDEDGAASCDDCDDADPLRYPGAEEECYDDVDNDCNGETDEGCVVDYTGTYTLDQTVQYQCAKYGSAWLIDIAFDQLIAKHTDPNITFRPDAGAQPGLMNGTVTAASFFAEKTVTGTCNEIYTVQGTFTSASTFTADVTAEFTGFCFDCTYQTWTVTGTK